MNWRVWKKVGAIILLGAVLEPASCQNYYLVVGAFATQNDAITEFTSHLPGVGQDTAYTITENNNVLHLYVMKSTNKEEVIQKTVALQREIERNPHLVPGTTEYNISSPVLSEQTVAAAGERRSSGSSAAAEEQGSSGGGIPPGPKGQYFKFTIADPNGVPTQGTLHYVDYNAGLELASYNSGTYIDILPPVESSKIPVVFGRFGYKEVEKYIDYNNPASTHGAYRDANGAWVIPYKLERLEKGDVSVMYNVGFKQNEAMMLPSSKSDLDELVRMMKENPGYVIRIHAHCNGRGKREIRMPGTPFTWFDTMNAHTLVASPKTLTRYRAEFVRKYLLEAGIRDERITTYAWGSSDMLVDADDPYAHLNDRIEIEILED